MYTYALLSILIKWFQMEKIEKILVKNFLRIDIDSIFFNLKIKKYDYFKKIENLKIKKRYL